MATIQELDRKEVELMNEAIDRCEKFVHSTTISEEMALHVYNVLARILVAKYMRQLAQSAV
jgi:hypothetical protein